MPKDNSPIRAETDKIEIKACAFCLENALIRDYQLLAHGASFYLCAPRGQLTEGYLAIAPYRCIGSLSQLPAQSFSELAQLKRIVEDFYRAAYHVVQPTFYEQGRAGGGAVIDEVGGFPLHAHLCCMPTRLDLHTVLAQQYVGRNLSGAQELPEATHSEPYVYVEGLDASGSYRRSAYVAHSHETRAELEHMRLKPMIARLMGLPGRGDWRLYPGDWELQQVVMKFGAHKAPFGPDCQQEMLPPAEGGSGEHDD
jgi:hypothetical protein